MANHKSAKKRARQIIEKRAANRAKKSRSRTFIKNLRAAIVKKDKKVALELLPTVQSLLGKMVKTGTMKKNTAARKTGRLAQQVNSL